MTNEIQRPTAKIYTFPSKGWASVRRGSETPKPAIELSARQYAITACGSAWYHEEAIEEAARQPKD
jgi:hypothetical protein